GVRGVMMSDVSYGADRCGFCGRTLVRRECDGRGGRPLGYCDDRCRRRAQRRRDLELRSAVPQFTHRVVAGELALRLDGLLQACFTEVGLGAILEHAAEIAAGAERVAAAAAVEERAAGRTWAEIGASAKKSEGQVRARWGGERAARLLAARDPVPRARADQTLDALGRALRTLWEGADVGLLDVAAEAGVPVSLVQWVLEGQIVAPWSTTYALVDLMGGQPGDIHLLWQSASKSPVGVADPMHAGRRLAAGLRGARLAAGYAPNAAVSVPGLSDAEVEAVFGGRLVPNWDVLCRMLLRLGAEPEPFKILWTAHQLASRFHEVGCPRLDQISGECS
ncbi:hypothetical protein ACFWN1_33455, partial [Streptomyces sp. NPDC058459]|uniref:hypothetical protein n=1 Tax=Streptomyces sp. NPDC058459 TaxID=3346508 RepID=UPI00364A0BBF